MSKDEQCAAQWMVRYHTHQCRRKGVVQEDGVLWCRQHAPSAERERRERAYAAHQEKARAADAERKRTKRAVQYHDGLVALLEEIKRELNGGMNTLDTAASAKPLEMKIDAILSAINRSAS